MSAVTLVLVPGLMCDQAAWAAQIGPLSAQAQPLSVAEHGDATSLQQMALQILEANPGPLLAAGHSMGGRVVLEMARLQPRRLSGVALLDTGHLPLATGEAGERERSGRLAMVELARRQGLRAMAAAWVRNMVHPQRLADESLIESILSMFSRRTLQQFEAQQQALLARADATDVLSGLSCPVLLLCGQQDQWSPVSQHQVMQRLIADCELTVVEHCGHMAPMEQPDAVTRALTDWLKRCRL